MNFPDFPRFFRRRPAGPPKLGVSRLGFPGGSPPRVLARDEVWSGSTTLDRVVVVPEGATLTIRAGARVAFRAVEGGELEQPHFIVVGVLSVEGAAASPVLFERPAAPGGAVWVGREGAFRARHMKLSGAGRGYGVWTAQSSSAELEDCEVRGFEEGLKARGRSRAAAKRCVFEENGCAAHGEEIARLSLEDCRLVRNGTGARMRGGRLRLAGGAVADNAGKGLELEAGVHDLSGAAVERNGAGIAAAPAALVRGRGLALSGNGGEFDPPEGTFRSGNWNGIAPDADLDFVEPGRAGGRLDPALVREALADAAGAFPREDVFCVTGSWAVNFLLESRGRAEADAARGREVDVLVRTRAVDPAEFAKIIARLLELGWRRREGNLFEKVFGWQTCVIELIYHHPPEWNTWQSLEDVVFDRYHECHGLPLSAGGRQESVHVVDAVGMAMARYVSMRDRYKPRDAYDVYLLCAFHAGFAESLRAAAGNPLVREALAGLRGYFAGEDSYGATSAALFAGYRSKEEALALRRRIHAAVAPVLEKAAGG